MTILSQLAIATNNVLNDDSLDVQTMRILNHLPLYGLTSNRILRSWILNFVRRGRFVGLLPLVFVVYFDMMLKIETMHTHRAEWI